MVYVYLWATPQTFVLHWLGALVHGLLCVGVLVHIPAQEKGAPALYIALWDFLFIILLWQRGSMSYSVGILVYILLYILLHRRSGSYPALEGCPDLYPAL